MLAIFRNVVTQEFSIEHDWEHHEDPEFENVTNDLADIVLDKLKEEIGVNAGLFLALVDLQEALIENIQARDARN